MFQHGNGPQIFELKHELVNFYQGTLSVTQYFVKVKSLWEELSCYKPVIAYQCGGEAPL